MRTRHRRVTTTPLALLATGALAAALIAPAAACADAAAHAERAAQHAALRASRAAEREARRAAREKAREERRAAREPGSAAKPASEPATAPSEGGAEGGAPAGGEGAANGCRPTLKTSSNHVLAGETVTLTGTIACGTAQAATTGQQVTISETERGVAAAASAAPSSLSAATAADGSFEVVTPALQRTTVFKVKLGKRGARAVVKVAPSVTLNAPASATLSSTVAPVAPAAAPVAPTSTPADETTGVPSTPSETPAPTAHGDTHSRVTFTGAVTPAETGSRVALQVAYGTEGWHTVALSRIAADGSYALAHRFRKAGQANVRVIAHMHGHNVNGVSPTLAYEVTTPASPAS